MGERAREGRGRDEVKRESGRSVGVGKERKGR